MDAIFLSSVISKTKQQLFRPMGPYQVAWYLRKHGYDVQVLEFMFKLSEEEILKYISMFVTSKTRLLGLGLMTRMTGTIIHKFENVLFQAKKRWPHIKIIAGGPAAALWSRLHRNKALFDYIITGHAEDTMLALCDHFYRDKQHPQFEIIDGNKFIKETFKMPHDHVFKISEGDHIWHKNDCIQPNESLPLEMSRGCIFKCKFCRYPYIGKNKNDFSRNIECVKNELLDNYKRFGTTNYYMLDDTFNANQDRIREFHAMCETLPFKINYATYLRADLLDAHPETQEMLIESGLKGAYLGIETFNKEAAVLIGKPWSALKAKEYIPRLIQSVWKDRANVQLGFICGLPPEKWEDFLRVNDWCIENNIPNWAWHALTINRDAHDQFRSEFDLNAEQYGFRWVLLDGTPIWQTDYCDEKTAQEYEIQLRELGKNYQRLGSWYLIEIGNYGYNLDLIRNILVTTIPWKEVSKKRKKFLEGYLNDLAML